MHQPSRRTVIAAAIAAPATLAGFEAANGKPANPADRLFEEFRQATLDWLRPMLVDGLNTEDPAHAAAFEDAHARIMRFGDEIKRLPHDGPGALRAKAAAAFYWAEEPHKLDDQLASEYVCERATADIIKASAMTFRPDYAAEIASLYHFGEARIAQRKDALSHRT
ncbi:MAG: hypothetical protein JNL45_16205 [Hyphomicrobium sp.]|nr:hypothetical protein [Hyphomicrobium sp.]